MATSLKSVRATAIASVLVAAGTSSGVKITSITYANSATAANPAGGETITVTGSGFNSGAKVYIDTLECTTTFVSATSLTFTTPVKTVASYMLYVYNTDGSSGVYPVGLTYSSMPVWVTASGAITAGILNVAYSQSVSATGDGTITYAVTSGSLPSGLSLNSSTGAITGTISGSTGTFTFTITATDSQNQKTSRSFSITAANTVSEVEYLVVAGGGGGGGWMGGGGGAGGYRTATGFAVTTGSSITVTVGAGGTGAPAGADAAYTNGNDSVFGTITSTGGGRGGNFTGAGLSGQNGGSGGGGSYTGFPPGTGIAGQGNNGGTGPGGSPYIGGGGGGANSVGGNATSVASGVGGAGIASSISGSSVTYAGGGGGGGGIPGGISGGEGGVGGGGAGGIGGTGATAGTSGTPNTGGGGGGAGSTNSTGVSQQGGGGGGSGVVIIRYPDTYPAPVSTTGSPTITNPTGYRVYKWTSSGSITF
jgi:hypothetical protein